MVIDSIVLSPHRRSQTSFTHSSFKRSSGGRDEMCSCKILIQRHRFLLTMLALLAFLCTIYLYFAVTLGSGDETCSGMTRTEKALCRLEQAKASLGKGKLKFF